MLSGADLSLAAGKVRKNQLVTGGFQDDFTYQRRLPVSILSINIAALGSVKRVTGGIFKICE
jgi:hypothetical protein